MQFRLPWFHDPPAPQAPRRLEVDGRVFPIRIVRHAWARRYLLRVAEDGTLRLTVPRSASVRAGLEFVAAQASWVSKEWQRLATRQRWDTGTPVWLRGVCAPLVVDDAAVHLGGEVIDLPPGRAGENRDVRGIVQAHLRALAAAELPDRCRAVAAPHGIVPGRISVRDQRSRWGACSGRGSITLNWRLIQMPPDVADYVMLHELAHLAHPNHSSRFWRHVAAICPGWKDGERWLRRHGRELL